MSHLEIMVGRVTVAASAQNAVTVRTASSPGPIRGQSQLKPQLVLIGDLYGRR
jgi:predicted nucleic acid-binding Zn ribbon protein